jgi:hypothetical protein
VVWTVGLLRGGSDEVVVTGALTGALTGAGSEPGSVVEYPTAKTAMMANTPIATSQGWRKSPNRLLHPPGLIFGGNWYSVIGAPGGG